MQSYRLVILCVFHDIASVVCRQPNRISKTLRRHLKLVTTDRGVRNVIISIERELSISDVEVRQSKVMKK